MKGKSYNEEYLIRELKQGSKQAFDAIYDLYAGRLYLYCLKYSDTSETAEEVVQNVFVRLWRIREKIKREDSLKSLLFIISKNCLVKEYHKRKRIPRFEDFSGMDIPADGVSAESDIESETGAEYLKAQIGKLPETQRKVVMLSKFSQLSNREIAQMLDLSEQTVRNQLSLGLQKLKRTLKISNEK